MENNLYKGLKFTGSSGNVYTVESVISIGTGQGDVYKVHNARMEKFAFKLFHKGNVNALQKQIDLLIKRGQACEAFVTPIETVHLNGRIGYVMEYVGKEYLSAGALFNGVRESGRAVSLNFYDKLALLGEIVDALCVLNSANLGIMDVKFENIKIDLENRRVKILDTDTIVYSKDKSVVLGTIGFMPPLTMIGQEKPNRFNDVYAVAVMIFMTLIGIHPLDGKRRNQKCNENIDTYLFGTHPVYVFHPQDASNRPIAQDSYGRNQQIALDKMKKYPDYFKNAMQKTFVDGLFDGSKRTSMKQWSEILANLYRDSFICENCGEEYFLLGKEKECSVCLKELQKPIALKGERSIHLFNGMTVFSDDIWQTTNHYPVFRVVVTEYDGRYGLENLSAGEAILKLKDGSVREFLRGENFPIFLDGEITVENKTVKFI